MTGSIAKESDSEGIKSGKLRVLWVCVFIGAFIGTAWHLHLIFKTYFDYGYYESVINKKCDLEFPDVTICASPSDNQVAKNPVIFSNIVTSGVKLMEYMIQNNISLNSNVIASPETTYANIHPRERGIYGADVNEIVLHCTFHGRPCIDFGNFVLFLHAISYNCYTFKYNDYADKKVSTGPHNGLSLILKGTNPMVALYDKTQPVGNVNGLKIVIHARDTVPFIMDKAINIQPGKSTDIGITMKEYKRLDEPYDNCAEEEWVTDVYNNRYRMNEKLCEQTAKFNEILETCSCYVIRYFPHKYYQDYQNNCLYINLANLSESTARIICQSQMFEKFDLGRPNNCSWPCEEMDYDVMMSQADWPQEIMIPDFVDKYVLTLPETSPTKVYYNKIRHEYYPENKPKNVSVNEELKVYNIADLNSAALKMVKKENISLSFMTNATFQIQLYPYLLNKTFDEAIVKWIRNSFYRVNIFFQKSTMEYHSQVIRYSLADLYAAAGGVCGLWVGISCISIVDMALKGFHCFWKLLQAKKVENSR